VTLIIHELQLASVAKIGNAMKSSGLHNWSWNIGNGKISFKKDQRGCMILLNIFFFIKTFLLWSIKKYLGRF
jgi:hypothetical protein